MMDLHKIFMIWRYHIHMAVSRKRAIAGFLFGIIISLRKGVSYVAFSGGHPYHFAEPFLQNCMGLGNITLILFGFLFSISDAPFFDAGICSMICRTDRKVWYKGTWLYILSQGILYYLFSFAACIIVNFKGIYTADQWSRFFEQAVSKQQFEKMAVYNLFMPAKALVMDNTPLVASMKSFLMILLYSLVLAGVLFVFNMNRRVMAGSALAAMIHIIGILMIVTAFAFGDFVKWSPLSNASLAWQYDYHISQGFSLAFYMICLIVIYAIGEINAGICDFYLILEAPDA